MEFNQTILTQNGRTLMAKAVSGQATIKFTKMRTSSSQYQLSQLEMLTSLSNVKQTSDVETFKSNGVTAKVLAAFDNYNLAVGYDVRTVGLYALDPDAGEILYAVSTASVSGYMPPNNGTSATGLNITIYTEVGNADNVNMVVDPAGFATKAELRALDVNVAYADDIKGGGFSKTDDTKLYKGYGLKNSNLATDYRWERNSTNLQIGGRNLFIDAGFKSDISTESDYVPGKWYSYDGKTFNRPKYDNTCNYLYFVTGGDASTGIVQFFDTNKLVKGKTYSVSTLVKVDANTTFKYQLVKKNPGNTYNWYLKNVDVQVTTIGEWVDVKWTFTIPKDDDGIAYGVSIRNLQTGTEPALRLLKPKLEIGNVFTGFSLAHEDLMLNASPINSVLTTLSQENPSTTLGGTWTQLGTESKFSNTIYYWKRTN